MTPDVINRAVWIGTAASVGTAVMLTSIAAWVHAAMLQRARMRSVAWTISITVSFVIFIVAALVMMAVMSALVNPPPNDGSFSIIHVYVNPGIIHKISPIIAIVATWLVAAALKRQRGRARTV